MYTNYDGTNFVECVGEVVDVMGESNVFARMLCVLEDLKHDEAEEVKKEIMNALWCM